ncbi:hypothetical protein ACHWQZ_G010434 [Mnemiopsis leidyi]
MGSFLEDFDEFLDCVFPKYDKFLICGDVNIQLDKKSAVSTEFVRILASYGLNQLINEPTHKAGHTLDMVTTSHKIIDNSTLRVLSDTLEIFKSCDHFPIIFTLQCKTLRSNDKKKIQFRSIEKIDKDRFSFDLLDKLARNKSFSTFEEHLDHYNATCSEVLDIHAPLLEKVIKDVPSAPWFDSEYKAARVARRKAEKVWLKSHLPIDRDIFNHLRLHCTELASSKKKLFFQGHFEKYSHSTKGLYKFVDVFLDNDAALKLPPTESLQDTVEEFNTFFTEKIKAIREAFSNSTLNEDPVAKVPVDIDSKLCEFRETSVEELKDILKSVKIKSCLADPLPAELVKDNLSILLPQLLAKNLGFYLDSTLDFTTQIKKLKSSCFNKLRHIAKMKKFLNIQQLQQLVSALIFSNLDYCNAIYYGASSKAIKQLQSIQNRACATILGLKRREPKSEHLKKLHWLKVLERIEFKILLVTYKALNGIAPDYISDLVKYYNLSGSRSPSLQTHVSKTSYGDRAFISCAAKLWNRLPEAIRTSPSVKTFKTQLKTHLFKKSFPT